MPVRGKGVGEKELDKARLRHYAKILGTIPKESEHQIFMLSRTELPLPRKEF